MKNIKFSHWFWITAVTVTVVFQGQIAECSNNDAEAKLLQESSEREAHSIESSQHRNYLETAELEDQPEFSTSKSVSVSRVRVEVGRENLYPRLRKIRKIGRKNRKKMKKSLLESIYSKLKEFARVSLASRRVAGRGGRPSFSGSGAAGLNNSGTSGTSGNSGKTSHEPIILTEVTPGSAGPARVSPSDHTKDEAGPVLLSQPKPEERLNVMSFNDFSDGPELVDTNDVLETNNGGADIETSHSNDNGLVTVTKINQRPRSEEARGRSLWTSEVSRSGPGSEEDQERNRISYASFTQGRAMMFDPPAVGAGEQGGELVAWTNLIILGVSMLTVFAFVSVLVVAVLYRRAKVRASSHCDQFSDILSTSSRSSSSTISSTRSGLAVPDKMDNISFHSEGQLRKSNYTCDDLYSLDSDYFLSSLEDISVQI